MNRLRLAVFLGLSLAVTGSSFAKDHGGKGRDRDDSRHQDRDRDGDHDRDDRHIRHHDRDDRRIVLSQHRSSRPPGWDRGRKTGWGDCNVPPGQAKKSGCNAIHRRHRHVIVVRHDPDRDGDRRRQTNLTTYRQ